MKQLCTIGLIAALILTLSNCAEKACESKKLPYPPNKDSELTLLMRDMYNYYDSIKEDIATGEPLSEKIKTFQDIHKAVATNPEKSESELYQAMATVYAASAERLNDPTVEKTAAFNLMVDNCMNCHEQMCPGPMVKIKKLYLE